MRTRRGSTRGISGVSHAGLVEVAKRNSRATQSYGSPASRTPASLKSVDDELRKLARRGSPASRTPASLKCEQHVRVPLAGEGSPASRTPASLKYDRHALAFRNVVRSPASRTPASLKSCRLFTRGYRSARISGVSHAGLVEVARHRRRRGSGDGGSPASRTPASLKYRVLEVLLVVLAGSPASRTPASLKLPSVHVAARETGRSPASRTPASLKSNRDRRGSVRVLEISGVSHAGLVEVCRERSRTRARARDLRRLARRPR